MTTTLPPKTPGAHRWIAIATHTLTTGQAAAAAAGSAVKLGPHNLVSTGIGCVDCEHEWPDTAACTAGAAPEMQDITATNPKGPDDDERMLAAVGLIGRSGARDFEVGHLEAGVPAHLARWYATATYQGAKVSSDEHASPWDAAEGLAWKILEGGQCVNCQRTIALEGHATSVPNPCVWARHGDCWVPGCVADVAAYRASRKGGAAS